MTQPLAHRFLMYLRGRTSPLRWALIAALLGWCCVVLTFSIPWAAASETAPEATATASGSGEASIADNDQAESRPFNPFADWQTHELDNGLRVWIKAWPGAQQTRASLSLPIGSAHEPDGLDGLAHYLEHVLFAAIPGKTEAEFSASLSDRGGSHNAHTGPYTTWYWSELPSADWRFGLQWLHQVLFDKAFNDSNIRAQLEPVLLEGGDAIAPRDFEDFLADLGEPKWVQVPGFVEREYGLTPDLDPPIGTWESLHRIAPEDVKRFYDRYYSPENMRLAVVGDVEPSEVLAEVEALFGSIPRGSGPVNHKQAARGREGHRVQHTWKNSKEAAYTFHAKLHDLGPNDHVIAWLLSLMTRSHLINTLRLADDKSVYGVKRRLVSVFGSRTLVVHASCSPEDLDRVRSEVLGLFERLARGDEEQLFRSLRDGVLNGLRRNNQTPRQVLKNWVETQPFFYGDIIPAMPDVIGIVQALTAAELAEWMQEHFREERTIEALVRPKPIDRNWDFPLSFAVFWLVLVLARRLIPTPVDLTTLRYLRKLRYPALQWLILFLGLLVAVGWISAVDTWANNRLGLLLGSVDSFALHWVLDWLIFLVSLTCILALPTLMPRKVLLFEDHWRIKFFSWRSLVRPYSAIRQVEVTSLLGLWRRGQLMTLPLAWSPLRRGVYLRLGPRFGVLIHTREPDELAEQVRLRLPGAAKQ